MRIEKVEKMGIVRESGWTYYVGRDGYVERQSSSQGSVFGLKNTEKIKKIEAKIERKKDGVRYWYYFIDKDGDVSRLTFQENATEEDKLAVGLASSHNKASSNSELEKENKRLREENESLKEELEEYRAKTEAYNNMVAARRIQTLAE